MRPLLRLVLLVALVLVGCEQETASTPEAELWIAEKPDSIWAWNQAAVSRMNRGDHAAAAKAFARLIELDPDEPFHYAFMALNQARAGESDEIRALMDKAVRVARRVNDPELEDLLQWQQGWAAANYDPGWTPGAP